MQYLQVPTEPVHNNGQGRRHRVVLAAVCLALALVGGYFAWATISAENAPKKDAAPFYYAAMNLAAESMVHYSGSSPESGANWNVSVTDGGEEFGTFTADGQQYGVLVVDGITYVKPPQSDLALLDTNIPVSELQGRWLAGDSDVTSQMPQSLVTPEDLASALFSGFGHADFPVVGSPGVQIDGREALRASIPEGTVYVTASAPYQVLQVDPPSPTSETATDASAATARSGSGAADFSDADAGRSASLRGGFERAASATDLGQTDLEPMTQAQDDQGFGNLINQTETLNDSPDIGVDTEYNEVGNLSCSDSNCTVTENVTTTTTSTQPAALSGGVSAVMNATVTVDGEPGGDCAATQTLPINGTGTMTCDDLGVAGPVAEIKAQNQEEANAEGQDINYTINFLADVSIEAMADVQANVTKQVQSEQDEQKAADNPVNIYKAPAKGLTQTLLNQGFTPEDFPGSGAGYPDGRAYFGYEDQGKAIALDYAGRGGYDGTVLQVTIPRADFEQYFSRYVYSYDGILNAEVAIPNTEFGQLNTYPRTLVGD
jgi:hypothetical protein